MPTIRRLWVPLVIALVAATPVVSMLLAVSIADANGCKLNEADAHPCLVAGVDIGGLLYDMFVLAWLGLLTVPLGVLGLAGWLIAMITDRLASRRRPTA